MSEKDKDMDFVNYLFAFTDDVGIFQHSKYGVPDRNHGYTTDDNARALILAVMLYEKFGKQKYLKLIYKYLSFGYVDKDFVMALSLIVNSIDKIGYFNNSLKTILSTYIYNYY